MNKKYIKIGFAIFFVVFVGFVIIRKLSMDEASSNTQLKKDLIAEKKDPVDPRVHIKLKDTTSKTNPKIKEAPLKNKTLEKLATTSEKIQMQQNDKKNIVASVSNEKKDIQLKPSPTEDIQALIKEKSLELQSQRNIQMIKEPIRQINIHSIKDLIEAKNDIKIDSNNHFLYKEKRFKEGDSFGVFTIVDIKPKKIRFKESANFFYNLRFFI